MQCASFKAEISYNLNFRNCEIITFEKVVAISVHKFYPLLYIENSSLDIHRVQIAFQSLVAALLRTLRTPSS